METLYDIVDRFKTVAEMIAEATESGNEDELEVLNDTLDGIGGELSEKADAIACLIKNNELRKSELAGRRSAFEEEAKILKAKETALDNANERLKKYLCDAMIATGNPKLKTDKFSFWTKASTPKVVIDGVVPLDYMRVPEPQPDKDAIKKAIKEGNSFEWAHLETHDIAQFR